MVTEYKEKTTAPSNPLRTLNFRNSTIIDVRTATEFIHGHIEGALHYPYEEIERFLKALKKHRQPLVVCSADDRRAEIVCRILKNNGLRAVNGGNWKDLKRTLHS